MSKAKGFQAHEEVAVGLPNLFRCQTCGAMINCLYVPEGLKCPKCLFNESYKDSGFNQETLDALWEHRRLLSKGVPHTDPRCVALQEKIDAAMGGPFPKVQPGEEHLLNDFLKNPKWIPTSQALPPPKKLVLCLIDGRDYKLLSYHGTEDNWPHWRDENNFLYDVEDEDYLPTHWRSLPEPPER